MQRGGAVVLVLGLCSVAAAGPTITIKNPAAPLEDVLELISDAGKVNIVAVDAAAPPLALDLKRVSWSKALDDVVKRSSLAYLRAGNLVIVGKPDLIAARKKAAKRRYKGKAIDLVIKNAEAPAAAKLVAVATGAGIAINGKGPRPATLRLKKVPGDQAAELVALTTGTTLVRSAPPARRAPSARCIADATQLKQLRLAGIAKRGPTSWALFIDPTGGSYVATKGNCIGVGATMILGFGAGTVSLDLGDEDSSAVLRPRP